tara:strand:- start:317 stop:1042 length:726 start_codon:yes stop_codon:yes gene_type:complete
MMDMHCHVDLYPDKDAVLADIQKSNFYVLSVTTVPSAWNGTVSLTQGIERCKTALGLHPQLAHLRKNELSLFDKLVGETRYIGEIGLDGSKGFSEHMSDQTTVLKHILERCEDFGDKVLSLHSLNATGQVIDLLKHFPKAGTPILHWFLGTKKQVHEACDLGAYFSIGPAMLRSQRGSKVSSWIPRDRVLLETDGPFAKIDRKMLFPSQSTFAIEGLANLWVVHRSSVEQQLHLNLKKLLS